MGSRPTEHVETELKFEVGLDFVLPDLTDVADGVAVTAPEVHLLAASYFDTADLRLAKAGITLRRRTGGADAGWHLKLPVTAGTRRELQLPLGDEATTVPAPLASPLSTWIRDEPRVSGRGDAPGKPATWREIEVELVAGGPEILAAAAARLTAAGARPSSSASKLGRLLGERAAGTAP